MVRGCSPFRPLRVTTCHVCCAKARLFELSSNTQYNAVIQVQVHTAVLLRHTLLPGLNRKQLLQHHPMAAIDYHDTSASSSTSQYPNHPLSVVPWEQLADSGMSLLAVITRHTEVQQATGSFAAPMVPANVPFYGTEFGPLFVFVSGVIDPINLLLKEDHGGCCVVAADQFHWAAQRSRAPPDSQELVSFVPMDRLKPDIELINKKTRACRCTIEVKKQ